jgi:hypothetical protein
MIKGAKSVVVSLWNVEDHSTTVLMSYFYTHLARGEDKAASLAEAKRDFIAHHKESSPLLLGRLCDALWTEKLASRARQRCLADIAHKDRRCAHLPHSGSGLPGEGRDTADCFSRHFPA